MTNEHVHSRYNDSNGDGPWWSRMILRYGIGTAFAAALLWALIYRIDGSITAMRDEHQMLMFYGRATCLNLARLAPTDERSLAVATCQPPAWLFDRLQSEQGVGGR